jgi:hypothetical protein
VYDNERAHANDAERATQDTTFVSKLGGSVQGLN